MSTRVLLIDHQDSYTWNLAHLIARVTGELPVVADAGDVPALQGFSHVVLSPGPGHPSDWGTGWVFDAGLPVLGVCMGMQLLVTRYGGEVAAIAPAHGVVSRVCHDGSGLFAGLPAELDVVRYHSLAATEVPPELVVTARTDGVVMALRHRELPLCGVQFHPESILSAGGPRLLANFLGGDLV